MMIGHGPHFFGGVSVTCGVTVFGKPRWGAEKKMGQETEGVYIPEEVLGITPGCYIRLQTVT